MAHESAADRAVILTLPPNRAGRDFLLGDLHGETGMLRAALAAADFDPARDRVISVGDLVDRGPDSAGALALVAEPWFFAVRGNHEEMMLAGLEAGPGSAAFAQWMLNGGGWIAACDGAERARLAALAAELPIAITLERSHGPPVGIVHAEYPHSRWAELGGRLADPAFRERLLWGRRILRDGRPQWTQDVAATVHGHTPVPEPVVRGNAVFIDTGAVYGGALTLIAVDDLLARIPPRA